MARVHARTASGDLAESTYSGLKRRGVRVLKECVLRDPRRKQLAWLLTRPGISSMTHPSSGIIPLGCASLESA